MGIVNLVTELQSYSVFTKYITVSPPHTNFSYLL